MDQKPQAIVHERHDSKEELERLFGVLKLQNSPTLPMRDRHLPQSFFSPPPNSSDGAPPAINNTTATLSTDTNFGLGDNIVHPRIKSSPASFQYHNNNNNSSTNSSFHNHQPPLHPKHHSSSGPFRNVHSSKPFHAEATHKNLMNPSMPMRQLPIASPVQQNGLHIRGSGSGLHPNNGPMLAKLPYGWEKAYTDDDRLYFVNHITKTTSWDDPRRSMMQSQNPNPLMQMSVNNNMEIPNDKAMQELQMMQIERKQLEQKREEMLRKESEIKRQLVSFQRQQVPSDQFIHRPGLASATGHDGIHNHNPTTLIKHEPTSPSPMQVDNYQPSLQHNPVDIQANLSQSQMMNYHHGNARMLMNAQLSNDGLNNQMMSETGNEPDIEELIQSLSATAQDLDIDANLMDRDAIAKIESELVNTGQNWY